MWGFEEGVGRKGEGESVVQGKKSLHNVVWKIDIICDTSLKGFAYKKCSRSLSILFAVTLKFGPYICSLVAKQNTLPVSSILLITAGLFSSIGCVRPKRFIYKWNKWSLCQLTILKRSDYLRLSRHEKWQLYFNCYESKKTALVPRPFPEPLKIF